MVTQLGDAQVVAGNAINDTVFAVNSPRPIPLQGVLERLRFADAAIGVAPDIPDQLVNPFEGLRICLLPVEIILPRIVREDEIHASSFNLFRLPLRRSS